MTGSTLSPDEFRDALAAALAPAYELGRELPGGGMSRVFLADERALGRTVVVKVLPPDLAAGVNRERFTREIQLAARLQHPHIVPLLSAGEAAGSLYYTMPYIEGESLRAELARGRRFGVREVIRVLHDVVEALAHAHARGVIHRDVKPGNVLMLGAHALVTDFGVAKALSAARQQALPAGSLVTHAGTTTAGLAIGTPAYMAPEQLAADPAADHRVDLYAAGLLAYELFVGESPFTADSPQATLAAQLTRVPTPLVVVRPDVPAALSQVIERCLAKAPEQRYPTADALLQDLEAVAPLVVSGAVGPAGLGPDAPTPPGTVPVTAAMQPPVTVSLALVPAADATAPMQPPTGAARRRLTGVFGGAILGMGLVFVGGWALVRGRETPPAAPPLPVAPAVPVVAAPAPPPAAAPKLTRDDSLAIAAAIERRLAAEERARREKATTRMTTREVETIKADAWQRAADSIRQSVAAQIGNSLVGLGQRGAAELGKIVSDAGAAAAAAAATGQKFRITVGERPDAPDGVEGRRIDARSLTLSRLAERVPAPKPGVRRVAVLDFIDQTPRRSQSDAVAAVNESLRRAVAARDGYEVADEGAAREATRLGLPPHIAAATTHAGAVVHGYVYAQRDSSLSWMAQVVDARGRPHMVRLRARDYTGARPIAEAFVDSIFVAFDRLDWSAPAKMPAAFTVPPSPPGSGIAPTKP